MKFQDRLQRIYPRGHRRNADDTGLTPSEFNNHRGVADRRRYIKLLNPGLK